MSGPLKDTAPEPAARSDVPALLRLCAGEPIVLTDLEAKVLDLINNFDGVEFFPDHTVDKDDITLATYLLEHCCATYGTRRVGKGDRVRTVASNLNRHLLPALIEMALLAPAGAGAGQTELHRLERIPQMLAGDVDLPAATVAAKLLRHQRSPLTCVYLSLEEAAKVVRGGATALGDLIDAGAIELRTDVRTGASLVLTADLRCHGLLIEPDSNHGVAAQTAKNMLSILGGAIKRATDHGAHIRGASALAAIAPLPSNRAREDRPLRKDVSLDQIRAAAAQLRIIGQVVLWIQALLGCRIAEIFGLRVLDYERDESGQGWLSFERQGGAPSLSRDQKGRLRRQDHKEHLKTPASKRRIPVPGVLADLLDDVIAIFHTDPDTGEAFLTGRFIPGIRVEDVSGMSAFRAWLGTSFADDKTAKFLPHDLRATLITTLKNAKFDDRLIHGYVGHDMPGDNVEAKHYDGGPEESKLIVISDFVNNQLHEAGLDDLKSPVTLTETWGRNSPNYAKRDWIETQLQASGWRPAVDDLSDGGRLMTVSEVANGLGCSQQHVRRLLQNGIIPARTRAWGQREIWVVDEDDVDRYLDSLGIGLKDLSEELDYSYHALLRLARQLDLVDSYRAVGEAIRLDATGADRLRREVKERAEMLSAVLTIAEAAKELELEIITVETLVRRGSLDLVRGAPGSNKRYVSRVSVEAFRSAYPAVAPPLTDDETFLTQAQARQALNVTRVELSHLVTSRQLRTSGKPGSRHVYIALSSIEALIARRA